MCIGTVYVNLPFEFFILHLIYVPEGSATRKVSIPSGILYKSTLVFLEFSMLFGNMNSFISS